MHLAKRAALAKLVGLSKVERNNLEPGQYEIDEHLMVHVKATVRVGKDYEQKATTSIPLLTTLALFMRYSGVTGPAALALLTKAMREALDIEKGEDAKSIKETMHEMVDLKAAEQEVLKALGEIPKVPKKGSVTIKGAVVEVESPLANINKPLAYKDILSS